MRARRRPPNPSPELPRALPHHPEPEQKVGDGMGGDGVTQSFLPANQPLVGEAAENASQPFAVFQTENDRRQQKRLSGKTPQPHAQKICSRHITVEERAEKDFLQQGHDKRGAGDPHDDEKPG